MVSVFTQPDVLPTSQVFTSDYVNTETILQFFYKITNERGTKTVFTYAHVKWFYGQSERAYYLNYFINVSQILPVPYFIAYFRPEVCKTECNSKDHKSSDNNEPDSPQPSLIFSLYPCFIWVSSQVTDGSTRQCQLTDI